MKSEDCKSLVPRLTSRGIEYIKETKPTAIMSIITSIAWFTCGMMVLLTGFSSWNALLLIAITYITTEVVRHFNEDS